MRRNRIAVWGWSQLLAFRFSKRDYLVTLTSRGPLVARNHVVVIHDLFVLNHPEWFSTKYSITHRIALRAQIRTAAILVAVSDPVAKQLQALPAAKGRVVVTAPNAPADVFLESRSGDEVENTLRARGLVSGGYLLTVANFDPRKNLSTLLRAYSSLDEQVRESLPLVVIGVGGDLFRFDDAELLSFSLQLGHVSDDELAALYSGSKAVLFPSIDEGFGLPAVEALACKARLIVSDIPVFRWVCGEYADYVPALSQELWAEAIAQVAAAGHIPLADSSAKNGHAYVADRFSWDQSAVAISSAIQARATTRSR